MRKSTETRGASDPRDVTHLLPAIIGRAHDVEEVQLHILRISPPSATKVVDLPALRSVVDEALVLREESGIPFWEAVLLLARARNTGVDAVLDAAANHHPMGVYGTVINLPAQDMSQEWIQARSSEMGADQVLVFSSKVRLAGRTEPGHVPMLDFRIRPSDENQKLAVKLLRRIGAKGSLLDSGKSYHFYGRDVLPNTADMVTFLGRASLFAPFVDHRWVAHQLIEGACALRVSTGKSYTRPPIVIDEV
jgi:hypothetical protein